MSNAHLPVSRDHAGFSTQQRFPGLPDTDGPRRAPWLLTVGALVLATLVVAVAVVGDQAAAAVEWLVQRDPVTVSGALLVLVLAAIAVTVTEHRADADAHDVR